MSSRGCAVAICAWVIATVGLVPNANAQASGGVGWYIGTGIGSGFGAKYSGRGTTVTFSDYFRGTTDKSPLLGLNLINVGATLGPNWLIGFTGSSVAQTAKAPGGDVRLQINNYLFAGTWFPAEQGFFLRGGFGGANIQRELPSSSDDVSGTGILFGLGYALRLGGGNHHITFTLDHTRQSYGSSATQPEKSQFSAATVGYMYRQ